MWKTIGFLRKASTFMVFFPHRAVYLKMILRTYFESRWIYRSYICIYVYTHTSYTSTWTVFLYVSLDKEPPVPHVRREEGPSLGTSKGRLFRRQRDGHGGTSAVPLWCVNPEKWQGHIWKTCIYIHTYIHIYNIHIYICVYIYIYTHMYKYTYLYKMSIYICDYLYIYEGKYYREVPRKGDDIIYLCIYIYTHYMYLATINMKWIEKWIEMV